MKLSSEEGDAFFETQCRRPLWASVVSRQDCTLCFIVSGWPREHLSNDVICHLCKFIWLWELMMAVETSRNNLVLFPVLIFELQLSSQDEHGWVSDKTSYSCYQEEHLVELLPCFEKMPPYYWTCQPLNEVAHGVVKVIAVFKRCSVVFSTFMVKRGNICSTDGARLWSPGTDAEGWSVWICTWDNHRRRSCQDTLVQESEFRGKELFCR